MRCDDALDAVAEQGSAVLVQFEQVRYMGAPTQKPTEERYSLNTLFNF